MSLFKKSKITKEKDLGKLSLSAEEILKEGSLVFFRLSQL
jgi:hypothetical protein